MTLSLPDPLAARLGLGLPGVLVLTFVKVAIFVGIMLIVGRRIIPWILHYIAHTGSRELFRLGVLAIALCVAFGAAKLFGVSLALGAFFAGMILSESPLSQRAAQESLPLRDAFAVLFFVSVGMLFDPGSVIREPWPLLATLFIIVIGKSLAAFLIVIAFRHPVATASDDFREPRPNRRILVHPCRAWRGAEFAAEGRSRLDLGRSDHLHHAQSVDLRCGIG